jgi:hypothetical protein
VERIAETPKQHEHSAAAIGHARAATPAAASLSPVMQLQQQAGNQAVQQLLKSGFIQAKLAISNPDDPEEREADQVAHTIMRKAVGAPASSPCSCSHDGEMCEECQQKQSQPTISRRASTPSAPAHVSRIVSDVLRSPGHPLGSATRAFFEPRFGHDFGHVRVHTDTPAAESARSINAHAYTLGDHLVFGSGHYSPDSDTGRTLLAHELVHVIHQGQARVLPTNRGSSGASSDGGDFSTLPCGAYRVWRQADAGVPPSDAGAPGGAPDQPGGEHYSKQAACVARLGGCYQTRDAGVISPEEIARYNNECKTKSEYVGPDITPSLEECRQYSTGQLLDPAKIQRLQDLNFQYLAKLTRGELTVADAQKIDAALRVAYAAIQRGGVSLPGVPPPVEVPPGTSLDGPAILGAALPALAPAAEETSGVFVAGTGARLVSVAPAAAEGAPVAAGAGAAATVGTVLVVVAVVVVAGLVIYWIITLKDPEVDPTIPKALDEASDTIEKILATAKPPVPVPVPPPEIGPLPNQRRTKDQTCTNEVLDQLQAEKDRICNSIPGDSCSPSKVSPKRLARRPCSEIRKRIQAFRDCLEIRQRIQDKCFGGTPDKTHEKVLKDLNSGLAACLALEAVNCAPGHPMENL